MTTYNTGNPVPSADARDRYDNSQTLDEVVNGESASYTTRTGKQVISLGGMNSRFNNAQDARESEFNLSQEEKQDAFQAFLEGTGWSSIGAYGAGVVITSHTQTVDYLGQPYSLKPSIPASLDAPYVTTGVWAAEGVNFKLVGDNSLRQDLADPDVAARIITWVRSTITDTENSLQNALNAQKHNLHEFSEFVVSKPNPINPATWDWTPAIQMATDHISLIGGGELFTPAGIYQHTTINKKPNVSYSGEGLNVTKFVNTGSGHAFQWLGTTSNRLPSFHMMNMSITGNPGSLDGIHIEWLGRRATAVALLSSVGITEHGRDGVYVEGADAMSYVACEVSRNGRDGFSAFSGSNQMNFYGGAICGNGRDGYFINQIASTCVLYGVAIHDNGGRGVRALRAEQPMVMNTAFNRNALSPIAFLGGTDNLKDVEAGIIFGCLFGDNNPTGSDIELNRVKVVNIDNNYFFNVSETKPYHIRISGRSDGVFIRGSRWKNSAANVPAKVSTDGSPDVRYVLEDTGATGGVYNTSYVGVIHQYLMSFTSSIVFQTRIDPGSIAPLFSIDASGKMSWGSGAAPADVSISRVTAGSLTVSGGIRVQSSMLAELASPPTAQAGFGRMYFDQATQTFKAVLPSGAVRTFTVT